MKSKLTDAPQMEIIKMAKADLEMALVKAQGRSPLSSEEMLELLNMDIGTLLSEHGMDLYQAEEVMMWRKHEALRWSAQLTSYPEGDRLDESRKLSKSQLDRMILTETTAGPPISGDHAIALGGGYDSPPRNEAAHLAEELAYAIETQTPGVDYITGSDEIYIMTGAEEGITVKVLRRGR